MTRVHITYSSYQLDDVLLKPQLQSINFVIVGGVRYIEILPYLSPWQSFCIAEPCQLLGDPDSFFPSDFNQISNF